MVATDTAVAPDSVTTWAIEEATDLVSDVVIVEEVATIVVTVGQECVNMA